MQRNATVSAIQLALRELDNVETNEEVEQYRAMLQAALEAFHSGLDAQGFGILWAVTDVNEEASSGRLDRKTPAIVGGSADSGIEWYL